MALDPDAVGSRSEAVTVTWRSDDALLYAVAVGAGQDPLADLELTTENTDGVAQQVAPSFGALLAQRVRRPPIGSYDSAMLVHAEQHLELCRPLPVAGAVELVAEVMAIHDKGTGAVVWTSVHGTEVTTGEPMFRTRSAAFIRGAGGFGGDRGGSVDWSLPDRSADAVINQQTRPEQALLYRLTGDRNPLHADPAFAARGGFDRPILHGMCTYGFAARAVARVIGGSALVGAFGGRFTAPVIPGDRLQTSIWRDGAAVKFRTVRGDGTVVIDRGSAVVAGEGAT